ncbi:pPIWI_RE_Y domain-containing protein [Actinoallomurus acaciae]|uniref:pPIWI-RE three-gene island domain-containing protein n=1 Tax=Actinoallomurus acaciae TaxID=502577 RepID=A0ABV5Y9V0_9ACTN
MNEQEDEELFRSPNVLDKLVDGAFDEEESLRILRMVALTVHDLADWPSGKPFELPYPMLAQRVVDRIALVGAIRHPGGGTAQQVPRSLPELMAYCRDVDLEDWAFLRLPLDEQLSGRLVTPESDTPSELCVRLAAGLTGREAADGKDVERLIMREIRNFYRDNEVADGYWEFLGTVIENPVLTTGMRARLKMRPIGGLMPNDELLRMVYIDVQPRYFDDSNRAAACAVCGLLMVAGQGRWRCEIEACPGQGRGAAGGILNRDEGLRHVTRPIRHLLVAPQRITSWRNANA